MKIKESIVDLRSLLEVERGNGKRIGFVPTMGALHEGHISLVKQAKRENDIVVCSIYVNPTQFNNEDDFNHYPVTLEQDQKLLEEVGCDVLFLPSTKEMYPQQTVLSFDFGHLENVLEGQFRPGHFNGVATVVSKFFNIVQPHRAYFGQKDYQQLAVIKQMVNDLNFQIDIIPGPTMREDDGLAMSSRNLRLSKEERGQAPFIYQQLNQAKEAILNQQSIGQVLNQLKDNFRSSPIELEYAEVVHPLTLKQTNDYDKSHGAVICFAGYLGNVRLIDNIIL